MKTDRPTKRKMKKEQDVLRNNLNFFLPARMIRLKPREGETIFQVGRKVKASEACEKQTIHDYLHSLSTIINLTSLRHLYCSSEQQRSETTIQSHVNICVSLTHILKSYPLFFGTSEPRRIFRI